MEKVYKGYAKGETCNREGCTGIINEPEKENCSCHINAPCHWCTTSEAYCPECGWEDENE